MKSKLLFESVTCSRCGGSGEYSFNMMDGSRCYGCSGRGEKLTKRGRAAQDFYIESRKVLVSDLKVGDVVQFDMYPRLFWSPITEIEIDYLNQNDRVVIRTVRNGASYGFGTFLTLKVLLKRDEETERKLREGALQYQSQLTKSGVLRKKA